LTGPQRSTHYEHDDQIDDQAGSDARRSHELKAHTEKSKRSLLDFNVEHRFSSPWDVDLGGSAVR